MRNRYSKILCLLLLFACCLPQEGNAFWPFKKKKKEDKKENLTPYQKLFKNKKVQTAHGLSIRWKGKCMWNSRLTCWDVRCCLLLLLKIRVTVVKELPDS